MSDAGGPLDAEYRGFVRSLHLSAVTAVIAGQAWLSESGASIWPLARSEIAGQTPSEHEVTAVKHAADEWDRRIKPQVRALVVGHPDPDVSDAAQFVVSRVWASFFVLRQALAGNASRAPDHAEVTRRVFRSPALNPSFNRLSRVVRLAPFRIYRPQPSTGRVLTMDPEKQPTFPIWLEHFERYEREFDQTVMASTADS